MTYSEVADLLLGDIPTPNDAEKYVNDASDEIDSKLGMRYVTPITVDETVPAYRSTPLLLKRINNLLASGRLILAKAASASQQEPNAYGLSMVNDALVALNQLTSGDITLPGASFLEENDVGQSGPIISNLDAQSNVESFYGMVTTPSTYQGQPYPVIFPSGAPYYFGGYRG